MFENESRISKSITQERQRQIEGEGWSSDHDDTHTQGEMLSAAISYLWYGTEKEAPLTDDGSPEGWPWDKAWWKPKNTRRNLERAGALCMAEIERCKRAGASTFPAAQQLNFIIEKIESLDREEEE